MRAPEGPALATSGRYYLVKPHADRRWGYTDTPKFPVACISRDHHLACWAERITNVKENISSYR
jgi:hypothetical protein